MPPSGLRPASSPMPASTPPEGRQREAGCTVRAPARMVPSPVRSLSGTPPSALATRVGHAARLDNTFGRTPAAAAEKRPRPRASPPGYQHTTYTVSAYNLHGISLQLTRYELITYTVSAYNIHGISLQLTRYQLTTYTVSAYNLHGFSL